MSFPLLQLFNVLVCPEYFELKRELSEANSIQIILQIPKLSNLPPSAIKPRHPRLCAVTSCRGGRKAQNHVAYSSIGGCQNHGYHRTAEGKASTVSRSIRAVLMRKVTHWYGFRWKIKMDTDRLRAWIKENCFLRNLQFTNLVQDENDTKTLPKRSRSQPGKRHKTNKSPSKAKTSFSHPFLSIA